MGLLRNKDEVSGTKYQMREKVFAIGDDFWIETDGGERAFKVNGKALRLRKTLVIETPDGVELFIVRERKLSVRDKMSIERGGETVATVKKRLIGIRERYNIDLEGGGQLQAKGTLLITSTRSSGTETRSRRSPSAGSECATPTASRSRRVRRQPS